MLNNVLDTTKNDEADKIVLIDSNALIHRSFHALPPLTTHDGTLVNAVYGFTSTVLKVLEDLKPRYIVATFDISKDTFRRKLYAEYKAQRIAAPQELYDQIPLVKGVCEVLNIPIFAVPGYEADDVIGTIVHKLKTKNPSTSLRAGEKLITKIENCKINSLNENCPVGVLSLSKDKLKIENYKDDSIKLTANSYKLKAFIITGDKDTYQLVNDDVFVYSIIKGLKNVEIIDPEYIQEKYGFSPELIVDYKALRGDPSDNIPGVPGIGEVTAKKLIQNFQSIENLYNKLEVSIKNLVSSIKNTKYQLPDTSFKTTVSEKVIKQLIENKAQAFLSKELSTIKTDVPLDFDLGCCLVHDYDKDKALKLFNKLEFKSLIKRLPEQVNRHQQESLF